MSFLIKIVIKGERRIEWSKEGAESQVELKKRYSKEEEDVQHDTIRDKNLMKRDSKIPVTCLIIFIMIRVMMGMTMMSIVQKTPSKEKSVHLLTLMSFILPLLLLLLWR